MKIEVKRTGSLYLNAECGVKHGGAIFTLLLLCLTVSSLTFPNEQKGNKQRSKKDKKEKGKIEYVSVVKGKRERKTASQTQIKGIELEVLPRKSSEDILRAVPGLLVVQHGAEGKGHQFFLRGFDAVHGQDIEVSLNSIPINDVSNVHAHGYIDLYFIIPEVIKSVTITKGAFLLTQSDFATAGSVDFKLGTHYPKTQVIVELGYPLRNRTALIHPIHNSTHSFVATEYVSDEGFGENRWSRRISAIGMITKLVSVGRLKLFWGIYSSRFGSPTALRYEDYKMGKMGFYSSYISNTEGQSQRAFISIVDSITYENGKLNFYASALCRKFIIEDDYTGWLFYPEEGDFRRQRHKAFSSYFSMLLNHSFERLKRKLALIVNASWRGDWIDQDQGRFDPGSGRSWLWERDATGGVSHLGGATGLRWSPLKWISVEGGMRADVFLMWFENHLLNNKHYHRLLWTISPRVTFRFPVLRYLILFTSYGRGLRSPELRSIGSGDLPHEDVELLQYRGGKPSITTSGSVEVGFNFSIRDVLKLSSSFFTTFISNETVFDHVSNTNLVLNSTRRIGGEVVLGLMPLKWLIINGSITYVNAKFIESGNPIPAAPYLMGSAEVILHHLKGLTGSLGGYYIAPRPLAHGATGMSQMVVNLTVAYRWKALKVGIQIENLLNRKNCEGQYHYASWFDKSEQRSLIPVIHCTAGDPITMRGGVTLFI